jgi:hypothetical protein
MKRKLSIVTVLLILICPSLALAEVPKYISEGFKAYEKSGSKVAIKIWLKGSALEGSQNVNTWANVFQSFEDLRGAYQGYDTFRSISIGPRSSMYLIIVNYENGQVYSKFLSYKKSSGEVVHQDLDFHTDIDSVWPPNLVYEQ